MNSGKLAKRKRRIKAKIKKKNVDKSAQRYKDSKKRDAESRVE
tara:strand:- start:422 stop:550 length:129 start_codon:yes stop_codon:yes gene_type:complete